MSLQHFLGLPRSLLLVGHARNTSPGRCPEGIQNRCLSRLVILWRKFISATCMWDLVLLVIKGKALPFGSAPLTKDQHSGLSTYQSHAPSFLIREQVPEMQELSTYPDRAEHHFLCWESWLECKIKVLVQSSQQSDISWKKQRWKCVVPKPDPWLCQIVLTMNVLNKTGDKAHPCRSPTHFLYYMLYIKVLFWMYRNWRGT